MRERWGGEVAILDRVLKEAHSDEMIPEQRPKGVRDMQQSGRRTFQAEGTANTRW